MPTASSPCPATASAPRSSRRPSRSSTRVGDFEFEEHLFGGASIDAHGTALTDEVLAACRGADAVLLAAVGGPKWDTTDPDAPRPEQGLLGLRKGLGPVRQPAPGPAAAGALRRQPAAPRRHRGHRPARRARAHRRHLLRREDPHRRHRHATSASTRARRSSGSRASPSAPRARRVDQRRQGQRAGDQPPVARGRHRASTPREFPNVELEHVLVDNARDAARLRAAALRRDPHREHVRRHPQRRGRDAHRLDRDAAERLARRGRRARPVRARPRLGARHRRPGDRQPAGDVPVARR